jgi:hypothetical protein
VGHPAQGRGTLVVVHRRAHDAFDGPGSDRAVVGDAFETQQAVVDVTTEGAEAREVAE